MKNFTIQHLTEDRLSELITDFASMFPWRRPADVVAQMSCAADPDTKSHILLSVAPSGRIAAMGAYGVNDVSASVWHLNLSATHPDFRRQGLNSELVRARLESIESGRSIGELRNIIVATRRPDFFTSFGFVVIAPNNVSTLMLKRAP